jgi:2-polyprenyl-6-methoxyphenol hydroxylase-like FAD-dependent oxidoreductase
MEHPFTTEAAPVVIVGASIAGLATALSLSSIAGFQQIFVLEKSNDLESPIQGAAVLLSPNGLKAIRALGGVETLEQVLQEGSHIRGNIMLNNNDKNQNGRVIEDKTLEATGLPQVLIRWGVLRRIFRRLIDETSGIHVIPNVEATSYRRCCDGKRIQVFNSRDQVIQFHNEHNRDNTAFLLVAADGVNSCFSKLLYPGNLKDNGRINIKAVVQKSLFHEDGITYSYFHGNLACFAGPAGDDYSYWAISMLSSQENYVDEGTSLDVVKERLLTLLATVQAPEFIVDLIRATASQHIFVRRSQESKHVKQLYSPNDNVVFVGDAAHAVCPSYGQGACMALEDAVTLASYLKLEHNLTDALKKYSDKRRKRAQDMVRKSSERTKRAVQGQPAEDISQQWIYEWEPPACTRI